MDFKIDYLFPWVNPLDEEWQKLYAKTKGSDYIPNDSRFRDLGWLKYLLRCLDINMPWLNKVHIILSSPSQIPDWLNTNEINIIYHKDFIPSKYLPTFNSNTIEMFIPKINCLEEHVIYGNDDNFTINPTEPTDFFTEDGTPKVFYKTHFNPKARFFTMCKRINDLVKTSPIDNTYIKQEHLNVSWRMSDLRECYDKYEKYMTSSITTFRDCLVNLNQYIYADYAIYNKGVQLLTESSHIGEYNGLDDSNVNNLLKFLNSPFTKTVCINDSGTTNKELLDAVTGWFEEHYPNKCRFEK